MWRRKINIPKPLGIAFLVLFGAVVIYILSIGPVWRISDPKMTGKPSKWAEVLYSPLCHTQIPWVNDALHWYLALWYPKDAASGEPKGQSERQ